MVTLRTGQVTWPVCCRVDDAEVRPGLFDSVTWTLSSPSLYEWCDHTQTEWSLTTWPLTLLTNRMLTAYIFSSLKLNSYREVSFPSSPPPLICHPYLGMWDKFYINGVTTYFKEGITHHIHTSTELWVCREIWTSWHFSWHHDMT